MLAVIYSCIIEVNICFLRSACKDITLPTPMDIIYLVSQVVENLTTITIFDQIMIVSMVSVMLLYIDLNYCSSVLIPIIMNFVKFESFMTTLIGFGAYFQSLDLSLP